MCFFYVGSPKKQLNQKIKSALISKERKRRYQIDKEIYTTLEHSIGNTWNLRFIFLKNLG